MENLHRTYEPLKFLGRLFWVPLPVSPKAKPISYSPSWESTGAFWGPTVVTRIPFTRWGIGVGVWLNAPEDVMMVHEADAEYDAYVAVNGQVNREEWDAARKKVAAMNLDPDQEMEVMQSLGIFE